MKKKTTLNQSFYVDEARQSQEELLDKWMKYLNFRSVDEYKKWCRARNFEPTLNKSKYLLEEEKKLRAEELILEEERRKKFERTVGSQDIRIKKIIDKLQPILKNNPHLQQPWKEILSLRSNCVYFSEPFLSGATHDSSFYISAYFRLAQFGELFATSPLKIKIKKSNPLGYFEEVLHRLIGKYPVPRALISWWFADENKWARAYVDLAQGQKVYEVFKSVDAIPLTHRQINLLLKKFAPHTYSYEKARLQAILASIKAPGKLETQLLSQEDFLGKLQRDYPLKLSYLTFLAKEAVFFDWNLTIDLWHFILHLREQNPQFSLKGRTLVNLLEGMHMWHVDLGLSKDVLDDKRAWSKTGINDYQYVNENNGEKYTITELTTGRLIHAEGKIMHHCVYSYVARCEQKMTAIFSMKYFSPETKKWKNVGTVEINLRTGKVVQFKAKYNAVPDSGAQLHLRKWALTENISV